MARILLAMRFCTKCVEATNENFKFDLRFLAFLSQIVLPTFPLMLGARDEAAEFDEMDATTPAEMFNDDPRFVLVL